MTADNNGFIITFDEVCHLKVSSFKQYPTCSRLDFMYPTPTCMFTVKYLQCLRSGIKIAARGVTCHCVHSGCAVQLKRLFDMNQ